VTPKFVADRLGGYFYGKNAAEDWHRYDSMLAGAELVAGVELARANVVFDTVEADAEAMRVTNGTMHYARIRIQIRSEVEPDMQVLKGMGLIGQGSNDTEAMEDLYRQFGPWFEKWLGCSGGVLTVGKSWLPLEA